MKQQFIKQLYVLAVAPALLLVHSRSATIAAPSANTGIVTIGPARFTVITPECIRIEYSKDGQYVDQPSLFAANRSARYTGYQLQQKDGQAVIDTGAIHLVFHPDGQPLDATNLSADIRSGSGSVHWTPGAPNPGNLGGTVRTLDGWDGPGDLGQGILSRDGWYLLDDSRSVLFTKDWAMSRPQTAGTDWYLFGYGSDYKGALKSLTAVGGSVPLPRKYALGAWYSRYWPYSSDDYHQIVNEYKEHDFPLDNIVMDMDWHKDGWTGWSWNRKLIPNPEDLLKWFHDQGLHVTVNTHPADGVGPQEDTYDQFMRDMGADPFTHKTIPFDAGDKHYLDTMYKDTHDPLVKAGVDFFWLDWQQYPFTRSIPDLTNLAWLNHYYFQYTARNGQRGMSMSRWAGWGDHRYPIHFSGDASTSWKMLAFEVAMTSTASNVGCFFWSHDIGGHNRGRNEESYTRWCQFGATSAVLRSHSTRDPSMDRRPWTYPKWAEESMRRAFHLRSELFPYIYSSAREAAHETVPLNRPVYIDYPGIENAYHNSQEYLYGDNLLVAPIVTPGVGPGRVGRQVVWFPPGEWYNLFTGERFAGNTERLVSADINEFPIYARGGVPLPMQPYTQRMSTTPLHTLRVRCYPSADGQVGVSTLYEDDGVTDAYKTGAFATTRLTSVRHGSTVTVTIGPAQGHFNGQLERRDYLIELPRSVSAKNVTVDGRPSTTTYSVPDATNVIHIPEGPIAASHTVVLRTIPADEGDAAHTAMLRRTAGILELGASQESAASLMYRAPLNAAEGEQKTALLALSNIGLVTKNEGPYGFKGPEKTYVFTGDPRQRADSVNLAIVDSLDNRVLAEKNFVPTGDPLPIDLAPASISPLPAVTAPGVSKVSLARFNLRASFKVGPKTISLETPYKMAANNVLSSPLNIARTAKTTASSNQAGYDATGLVDGIVGGYPTDQHQEWSSGGEKAGAWVRLDWDTDQDINRVWLFDRPNLNDQVTSGVLTLSDGSTYQVSELPNDASEGIEVHFPTRKIRWLKFEVTGVKPTTENVGLSELGVFRSAE